MTRFQSSIVHSQVLTVGPRMPAPLTRTSMPPKRSTVPARAVSTAPISDTSAVARATRPPPSRSTDAASSASPSMSQSMTLAPEASRRSATARPIPRAAPVTTAVRPSKS